MDTAALHLKITSDGMDQAQKGLQGLENTAGLVESAFKKLVAAAALFKAGSFIGEITQLTARYETLGVVMGVVGNNAGYTRAQMEAYAQTLQKAGISMLESRNTLAQMASAHIDLANAQKLGRIAQDAAVIGNLNSSESFQRMIYGIQSGQVEILRTIGLNVNFEASYKKLAAQLHKNAQDLTEVEKVQARTNVVMEKGKDIAGAYEESLGTVGKAAKSMERIWENLQVLMGQLFQPAFTVIIDSMTAAMKSATEWAEKNAKEIAELGRAIGQTTASGVEFVKFLSDVTGGAKGASEGVGFLTRIFQGVSLIIAGTTDVLRAFWGELSGFIGDMIQKLGKVVDLATTLVGFSGKGGISRFGESLSAYGAGITAPLNEGTATGRTLDSMLVSHVSGPSSTASATESARIAEAAARKAREEKEAARAAAAAIAAQGIYTDTRTLRGVLEDQRDMKAIRERGDFELPQVATTDALEFEAMMKRLKSAVADFRKENVSTWDIISREIQDSSRMASDSLVIWMDNLDGVGRSWKTLGDTVKSVLRDMIIQMQRAVVQQQLMNPLMGWISAGITSWASGGVAGGGSATTGGSLGGGLNYGENFSKMNPTSGAGASVSVVINGATGDTKTSVQGGGAMATGLKQVVDGYMAEFVARESRQGGMLARA